MYTIDFCKISTSIPHRENFDHAGYLYFLTPDSIIDYETLHFAENVAGKVTEAISIRDHINGGRVIFGNDLPGIYTRFADRLDPRREAIHYRFMHALEHLVVMDLIMKGLGHIDPNSLVDTNACTTGFDYTDNGLVQEVYGFVFKSGFATHCDTLESLEKMLEGLIAENFQNSKKQSLIEFK
jgi:hypothetical protein